MCARHDDGRKNIVVVVFVLTRFGDARTTSEIRGLELRPELTPRAFAFGGKRRGGDKGRNTGLTRITPATHVRRLKSAESSH